MMEKRNVVESRRTPDHEIDRTDGDWDKEAAAEFVPPKADKKADHTPESTVSRGV